MTKSIESVTKQARGRENGNIKNFMMLSGVFGSYMEGYVIEKTTGVPGVSSISVIKEAKARGIDIRTLSEQNKDEIASLKIDASVKKEIEKAINNGKIVVVPEKDIITYLTTGNIEGGMEIFNKALEAGVLFLIFDRALPKLLEGVTAKFESTKFFEFISKKWGGKTIELPDNVKPSNPDVDDIKPDPDDPKPDPDDNPNPDRGNHDDDFWTNNAEKYGDEFVDNFKPFGEDGKRILNQYGDDLVDVFDNLSEADIKKAIELINEYGDEAAKLLKNNYSLEYTQIALKYGTGKQEFSDWDSMKEFYKGKVTKFVNDCKPKYSPKLQKWFENGGTLEIEINNGQTIWRYTNSSGVSVPYVDGYVQFPDEYFYPDAGEIDIGGFSGNRDADMKKLLEVLDEQYDMYKIPEGYVAHHDINNGIIQLIEQDIHAQFTHIGGHSICGGN